LFDLVFRNALLVDGTGAQPRRGDLAVSREIIAETGTVEGRGKVEIDADGLALMPGIIDNHTHYDAQITWDPSLSPSPALGVTTAVIGNCGFTIAPCRPADRERVMRNLTQVEGMSLEALRSGIRWDFESVPQYLAMLESRGAALNVAAFVGHSSVRTYVMGEAATERAATPAEVEAMRQIVLEAMAAGTVGFSTSTSPAHNGEGGKPMPSRLADEHELATLVGALGEAGRGVFMLTKGGQTSIEFLESLAAASGRPVVVAALFYNGTNPDAVFRDLAGIEQANRRGRRMVGAVSCCPLAMEFTLRSPYTFEGLASWQPALGLRGSAYEKKLEDDEFRRNLRAELARPAHFRLFNGEWDKVQVIESREKRFEQRTIAALAREAGRDPLDFMLDLALGEDLETLFSALLLNSDEAGVARVLRHPCSLVSLSDAGAHLTFFNDAGFGLELLGRWSRELGVLTLAEAARRLTGQPARLFGIRNRGELRPGWFADLLLFDPQRVRRKPNRRAFDLPAGQPRLVAEAFGVHGVWVNGTRVVGGNATRVLPGRVLREFDA
jgi:N-acyl-D-aspartate/D-glutamate deacylase